jgi:hypothetical protein
LNLFTYLTELRSELLEAMSGAKDSENYYLDESNPSWLNEMRLKKLLEKYLSLAESFGGYLVTRHAECPNPSHYGYYASNSYGLDIKYDSLKPLDEQLGYKWTGHQFFIGNRECICPCSPDNTSSDHRVFDEFIFSLEADEVTSNSLPSILMDILIAVNKSGHGKARSGAREHLLRAVLKINDLLLPLTVDEYISQQRMLHDKQ